MPLAACSVIIWYSSRMVQMISIFRSLSSATRIRFPGKRRAFSGTASFLSSGLTGRSLMLKLKLLLFDLGFQQRLQPLNQFQKVAFFLHLTHLSAFNFGHIQNVVDQGHQVLG